MHLCHLIMAVSFWIALCLKCILQTILQKKASEKCLIVGIPCGLLSVVIDVFALHELSLVVYMSAESIPIALCLVYEALKVPASAEYPVVVPLLNRYLVGVLLITTAAGIALRSSETDVVEQWWRSRALLVTLLLLHCAIWAISFAFKFKNEQIYMIVSSTELKTPHARTVAVWGKRSQFARIVRIGISSAIASTAAQAFLRLVDWSLKHEHFPWEPSDILFVLLGISSLVYISKFKRECFRSDFYFGMLAMNQLFSLSCISILDGMFIHKSDKWHFVQPTIIILTMFLALVK